MFNFNLMNRALNDSNLSDKAFRMLYTIINYCSLKNSNSVEVHNAHLMMVLNSSERHIRRLTNELVEKGYITKKVNGTSQNKLANTYTLIDVEVNDTPTDSLCNDITKGAKNVPLTDRGHKSDAQNVPLKNNNKINKKYNIHVNIHDNMNTGNNKIEDINNINLNKENVMNEERMSEMNDMNNSTLEEMLETQALDDNQAFNTFSSFKNKEINYSKPEQERYQRLFNKCKSQIEIWSKTHEYSCISIFDSFYKVIQFMHQNKTISDKQWEAAQHHLLQRFINLRNGYSNYVQNKKKHISSMEFNDCKNPQPPRQQNDQIEEAV